MFKKIPYGVKVRVRGSHETGFVAECAICCIRFFPFMDTWCLIKNYNDRCMDTFPTLEAAQKAAMAQYESWMDYYERKADADKLKKKLKKSRTIWEHP